MPVQGISPSPPRLFSTYSFLNIVCTISGPNGAFPLGAGSASAEEGITVEPSTDQSTMTIGADGSGMYSLHADFSGRFMVRLLLTSPTNQLLANMFEADRSSAAFYGQNLVVLTDVARGDNITGQGCAIMRAPNLVYGREGGLREWTISAIVIHRLLGSGVVQTAV